MRFHSLSTPPGLSLRARLRGGGVAAGRGTGGRFRRRHRADPRRQLRRVPRAGEAEIRPSARFAGRPPAGRGFRRARLPRGKERRKPPRRAGGAVKPDEAMPPEGKGDPLTPGRSGSSGPGSIRVRNAGGGGAVALTTNHWSFQPVGAAAPGACRGLGSLPHRRLHPRRAQVEGPFPLPARGWGRPGPPALPRRARPAADARGGRGLRERHRSRRLGAPRRPRARQPALRRALGPPLAGRGAVRRSERLRNEPRADERLAITATT